MSVGPRIVFTRFASGTSPKLRPWREHVRRVTGFAPDVLGGAEEGDGVVVWNLVSANNRELGRGAQLFHRFADAVIDAQSAVDTAALMEVALVSGDHDGVYGWKASLNGHAELICARWYQTGRDRQHALMVALSALAVAALREGARSTHPALMAGERSAFDE
jgi:hypothetical protein